MVTSDIIALMRSQVADEMQFEQESRDRIAVYTPFLYQDGDQCSFLLVRNPATERWFLTDEGEVLAHASYSGADLLSEERISRFRATTNFYGLSEMRGELHLPVEREAFGNAFFTFSQACLDLVQLTKLPPEKKERTVSDFRAVVRNLITAVVPSQSIEERWYNPESDPERVYPVDIKVRGRTKPLYVYVVTTEGHCLLCAISCLHHTSLGTPFSGVAIFDNEQAIPKRKRIPLLDAVEQKFSASLEPDQIRDFFLANAG